MPALVQYPCSRRAPSVMDADAVARFHAVAELEVIGPVKQAAALLMAFVIAMAGVGALVWGIRKR